MPEVLGGFNPSRLALARTRRGLSKSSLASAANLSVRSISAFERGEKEPSIATLERLATLLRFPVAWLTNPNDLDEPPREGSSFRGLSTLTATLRDKVRGAGAIAFALTDWLDARYELPPPDVPKYEGVDPETAADAIRRAWGLGVRPIRNMVHLLEAHGVRVFSLAEDSRTMDAYSVWRVDRPYVFLNTMKSGEHRRMDAAHELGHLVLHWRGGAQGREAESEASLFGASFLMPRDSLTSLAPRGARLDRIIEAKGIWGVSAAALTYRLHKVGRLTDWQYRSLFIELSRLGYRTNEPDGIPGELSWVLSEVFRMLRDDGTGIQRVADELNINTEELNSLVFGLVLIGLPGGSRHLAASRPSDLSRPTGDRASPFGT